MKTWEEVRAELHLTKADECAIELEKELIRTMAEARERAGFTQSQLADLCGVKQPVIARMETGTHSPQVDSLLKVLIPLGYKLKIVPIDEI